MDYNLKKENRKKFQDKQKLNRRHRYHPKPSDNASNGTEDGEPQEQEQQRIREYDITGTPILFSDEELDEIGNIVPKGTTNSFRYKEELQIQGLDKEEEEYLKGIDLKKLSSSKDIDLGHVEKDIKKLSVEELSKLKIVDKDDSKKSLLGSDDIVPDHRGLKQQIPQKHQQESLKTTNKVPPSIRNDEAFLDDLL